MSSFDERVFAIFFFVVPREQAAKFCVAKGVNAAEPIKEFSLDKLISKFSAACAITEAISGEPFSPLPSRKNTDNFSEEVISSYIFIRMCLLEPVAELWTY